MSVTASVRHGLATLNAVITHLRAPEVQGGVAQLCRVAPDSRFVVCHGGSREDFERIERADKVFVDEPTLRGPARHLQSWTSTFNALREGYFRSGDFDSLYLFEYDHLVLRTDFEGSLRDLAERTQADFMGKNCVDRTATNWQHYVRFRRDDRLLGHLRRLSVREDPERLFGCLGDGMWLSRGALEAYCDVGEHPPCYNETYVPTLLHHLGLRVVDIDAHSDLYRHVRWVPPYSPEEVEEAVRAGATFMHPVKDPEAVAAAARAGSVK